jgi:hypothetical protein
VLWAAAERKAPSMNSQEFAEMLCVLAEHDMLPSNSLRDASGQPLSSRHPA